MNEPLVRITFRLEPDAWHGSATERLWAEPVGGNRFRLRNSPFYAFDVSNEDIVFASERDGQLEFDGISIRGGHSTYRLKLREHDSSSSAFLQAWAPIERAGCSFEQGPVLAVDVRAAADIYQVYTLLEAGKAAGLWDFEEGHCGHALRT